MTPDERHMTPNECHRTPDEYEMTPRKYDVTEKQGTTSTARDFLCNLLWIYLSPLGRNNPV